MKLFAYTVLDDVKRAYELLENVDQDEQLFRIYWVTCIGLLRTISEVLKKEAKTNSKLAMVWKKRFAELEELKKMYKNTEYSNCPEDFLFWSRLFKIERDFIVHEYCFGYSENTPVIALEQCDVYDEEYALTEDVYRPMEKLNMYGDMDCRDWIYNAICWWEKELSNLCAKIL